METNDWMLLAFVTLIQIPLLLAGLKLRRESYNDYKERKGHE